MQLIKNVSVRRNVVSVKFTVRNHQRVHYLCMLNPNLLHPFFRYNLINAFNFIFRPFRCTIQSPEIRIQPLFASEVINNQFSVKILHFDTTRTPRPVAKVETKRFVSIPIQLHTDTTFTDRFRFKLVMGHSIIHLVDDVEDVLHGERVTNLVDGAVFENGRHVILRWKNVQLSVT